MWLIRVAMRRPISILMVIVGIGLMSILAVQRMAADIFPELGTPVIYVAQPYGGMDPAQMEGYLVNYYEYHFLYVRGIDYVESRSIQGAALMALHFHEGTDMAQAMAETVAQVNRSRSFMPPGTVPPFVMRFDAGSVPVGYLVFSSETRSVDEIFDLALFRVRPMFAAVPGVSAPPPFGGTARSLVVRVDPDRLRSYKMSPDEVVSAIARTNTILPSGSVRIGDVNYMTPVNSTVRQAEELNDVPLRSGQGATVYLRDIGYAEDGSDILTSYALVNGRRTVYIAVTKRADASTLEVVRLVRESLPTFRAAVPEDIDVSFEFDQSFYVTDALSALQFEGVLGALLTGGMIFLALGSLRSAVVVVTTIPLALLSALVALWAWGQTINLMTLGGLTLAIGILVDESVIVVENIHRHLADKKPVARAVLDATQEVVVPLLLIMLSILAIFAPSFFMTGVARAMFVPLALSVGFAMASSFLLANTFVPIMETWLQRKRDEHPAGPAREEYVEMLRERYTSSSERALGRRGPLVLGYLGGSVVLIAVLLALLGTEIFPGTDTGLVQMRLRAPAGTRVERTESLVRNVLDVIEDEVGAENLATSLAFVGVQPSSFPVNLIFLWTGGPHEAVLLIRLAEDSTISAGALQERLRERIPQVMSGASVTFEAADLVSQVMSFGAPTPIQIAVTGSSLAANRERAELIREALADVPSLRDVQLGELLEYPTLNIDVDRERAAQLDLSVIDVGRALAPATWSSRFTTPVYWADPNSGIAYQVQVEIPQARMSSIDDVAGIPLRQNGEGVPTLLRDVATLRTGESFGEYHRRNAQRMVTVTANVHETDLGSAAASVASALRELPEAPPGMNVTVRGQLAPLSEIFQNLRLGVVLSMIAVFVLLVANFQSGRVALAVVTALPAVLVGVGLALLVSGQTLNLQSFMGAMMAIGISVANSILLCTFAERYRQEGLTADAAALQAGRSRLRPIVMTSLVMVSGMLPMAFGTAQTAPLAIAVIGGLLASLLGTLFVVPSAFAILMSGVPAGSPSIDPDDASSHLFDRNPKGESHAA
ncbi:MAG TPA: efflux RND transporter permease subunit [Vicinamibacteria bacterium]